MIFAAQMSMSMANRLRNIAPLSALPDAVQPCNGKPRQAGVAQACAVVHTGLVDFDVVDHNFEMGVVGGTQTFPQQFTSTSAGIAIRIVQSQVRVLQPGMWAQCCWYLFCIFCNSDACFGLRQLAPMTSS